MSEAVSSLIIRFVDQVLNGPSPEAIDELFHPGFKDHDPLSGIGVGGVAELRVLVAFLALPTTDIRFTLETVFEVDQQGAYRLFGEGSGQMEEFSKLVAVRPATPLEGSPFTSLRRGPAEMNPPLRPPPGVFHYEYSGTGIFAARDGRFTDRWGRAVLLAHQ